MRASGGFVRAVDNMGIVKGAAEMGELKYGELVYWIETEPALTRHGTSHPALIDPVRAFTDYMQRTLYLVELPARVAAAGKLNQRAADLAEFRVTRRLSAVTPKGGVEVWKKVRAKIPGVFQEVMEKVGKGKILELGINGVESQIDGTAATKDGLTSLYAAALTSTWTAFETLAGDLWERAVNACPVPLAELNGTAGRIDSLLRGRRQAAGWKPAKPRRSGRTVHPAAATPIAGEGPFIDLARIGEVSEQSYNLKGLMGSLLKGHFEFHARGEIRRAYSKAFWYYSDKVDESLSDPSIDALCAVRNLIVHKGGKADRIYVEVDAPGTPAPQLDIGKPLVLDGALVRDLVRPVFERSMDLISAVSTWIQDEADGKHRAKGD